MAAFGGQHDRRLPAVPGPVDLRPAADQRPPARDIAELGGDDERRRAVEAGRVHQRSGLEELLNALSVPVLRRQVKRSLSCGLVRRLNVSKRCNERGYAPHIPKLRGPGQRRESLRRRSVDEASGPN